MQRGYAQSYQNECKILLLKIVSDGRHAVWADEFVRVLCICMWSNGMRMQRCVYNHVFEYVICL